MTDITSIDDINSSCKAQKLRDASKRFYNKKIKNNAEFYAAEKERIKIYNRNRYNSDPEFAEKMKQKAKNNYLKKKAAKEAASQQ